MELLKQVLVAEFRCHRRKANHVTVEDGKQVPAERSRSGTTTSTSSTSTCSMSTRDEPIVGDRLPTSDDVRLLNEHPAQFSGALRVPFCYGQGRYSPGVSDLVLPFVLHGAQGRVLVRVAANVDPTELGCLLLDPGMPATAAQGFPVCQAEVEYERGGYFAAMGWVQFVRSTDGQVPGKYELDRLALFRGVDTPYAFFGVRPCLFDAPFRGSRAPMTWRARSFLCASPDLVMSRTALPLCAFTWGFTIAGHGGDPVLAPPQQLPLDSWSEHLALLEASHRTWRFRAGSDAPFEFR